MLRHDIYIAIGRATRLQLFLFGAALALAGQSIDLPAPTGKFPVGTTIVSWTDPARPEPMSGDKESRRRVLVQIWYPAQAGGKGSFSPYIPEFDQISRYKKELNDRGLALLGRGIDRLKSVRTHSLSAAAVSDARATYPVLIFSPGNSVPRSIYTVQMEELASHGYVVAGIDHPYSVAVVAFPDGQVVLQPDVRENQPSFEERAATRAADIRFVIDRLSQLAAGDTDRRFAGRLDLGKIGVFGHSLGGVASVIVCAADQRVKAVVNLDGGTGEIEDNIERGATRPLMLLVKEHPAAAAVTDAQLASWGMSRKQYDELMSKNADRRTSTLKKLSFPAYRVSIRRAEHMNFSDARLLENDNKGIDARRALQIVNAYTLAFFDQYLENENSLLLTGVSAAYPEVIFEVFRPEGK